MRKEEVTDDPTSLLEYIRSKNKKIKLAYESKYIDGGFRLSVESRRDLDIVLTILKKYGRVLITPLSDSYLPIEGDSGHVWIDFHDNENRLWTIYTNKE